LEDALAILFYRGSRTEFVREQAADGTGFHVGDLKPNKGKLQKQIGREFVVLPD
jgi:hypothetical protein